MTSTAWLYAAGALPFLLLGTIHALYTWRDRRRPAYFAPRSADLLAAMQAEGPALAPATTLWRAGLGFHFSHSLGVVGFGLLYLWLALAMPAALAPASPLLWAAPAIAGLYVLMAWRYWFHIPLIGSLLGFVLFAAGAVAGVTGVI